MAEFLNSAQAKAEETETQMLDLGAENLRLAAEAEALRTRVEVLTTMIQQYAIKVAQLEIERNVYWRMMQVQEAHDDGSHDG